jgi:DNA-binding PadR family transcriptional regulator
VPKRVNEPRSFLPLSPAAFYILLSLADGPQHGYAIMRAVREVTEETIQLGPGTLYRVIATLEESGLIEETTPAKPSYDDARRRYYSLLPLGRRVLAEETRRMAAAVEIARAKQVPRLS